MNENPSARVPLNFSSFTSLLTWTTVASLTILTTIVAALFVGARGDYAHYMSQWELVLSADDPWTTNNTYGPAHNLLAVLFAFHPMLPKLVYVLAWQISSWCLIYQLARHSINLPWLIFWLVALPFNPLFWSFGVVYGTMDSLVATLCLSALACRHAGRNSASASLLAFAVLLKIYPIIFVPFLILDGRRINWKFLATFGALIAAGLALSLQVWGESTFHSVTYNSGRGSTLLSIFRFLRGNASPLKPWVDNLDSLSIPLMAIGGSIVFMLAWKWRTPHVFGALTAILVTLTLYKVGYHQYFLVVPFMVGLWYAHRLPHSDRFLTSATITCLGWISFVSILYLLTHAYNYFSGSGVTAGMAGKYAFISEWVGLPTFFILVSMLAALIRNERRHVHSNSTGHTVCLEGRS